MNGSFVNGEVVRGQRRLHDGDALRLGDTVLVFRRPTEAESLGTAPMADLHRIVSLSETQRRSARPLPAVQELHGVRDPRDQ